MRGQQHVYPSDRLIVVMAKSPLPRMVIVPVSSTSVRAQSISYIGCGISDGYGTPTAHRLASFRGRDALPRLGLLMANPPRPHSLLEWTSRNRFLNHLSDKHYSAKWIAPSNEMLQI